MSGTISTPELIEKIVKILVDRPDEVELKVAASDMGVLFGRERANRNAISSKFRSNEIV